MTLFADKVRPVKMVLLDVDGVMTDGGITYEGGVEGTGAELKRFDIQDGMGITMALKAGLKVGILTGRTSPMVEHRARELSIGIIKQGFRAKLEGWRQILEESSLSGSEVAYIGDDVQDLPVLWRAGFSAAPANAVSEVKSEVDYVCQRSGGHGAVREFIDLVLLEKGIKAATIAAVTGEKP